MFVLDSNLVTVVIDGKKNPRYDRLATRLDEIPEGPFVTITSFQESMRGWLAFCSKAKSPEQYIEASRKLHIALKFFSNVPILDFDDRAAAEFKKLKAAKTRVGTMDLRIAAIVLAHDGTLLSANLTDFRKVLGLKVEDWSAV